nr:MAG TPA: hypothetical protein [Microviridae sp.]
MRNGETSNPSDASIDFVTTNSKKNANRRCLPVPCNSQREIGGK